MCSPQEQQPSPFPTLKLSVVIPCFNEISFISDVIEEVLTQPYPVELIIVDDCSTDGTGEFLKTRYSRHPHIQLFFQDKNRGKGSALKKGIENATGEIVLIQDADLEYSPSDYADLLAPILSNQADVVYGTRLSNKVRKISHFFDRKEKHVLCKKNKQVFFPYPLLSPLHRSLNRFLTLLSNVYTNSNLSDMEVGYKAFRREVIQAISLEEERFGIEPEIVIKVSRLTGLKIFEVPVSYQGRTMARGKKFRLFDLVDAIHAIRKYGSMNPPDGEWDTEPLAKQAL